MLAWLFPVVPNEQIMARHFNARNLNQIFFLAWPPESCLGLLKY